MGAPAIRDSLGTHTVPPGCGRPPGAVCTPQEAACCFQQHPVQTAPIPKSLRGALSRGSILVPQDAQLASHMRCPRLGVDGAPVSQVAAPLCAQGSGRGGGLWSSWLASHGRYLNPPSKLGHRQAWPRFPTLLCLVRPLLSEKRLVREGEPPVSPLWCLECSSATRSRVEAGNADWPSQQHASPGGCVGGASSWARPWGGASFTLSWGVKEGACPGSNAPCSEMQYVFLVK